MKPITDFYSGTRPFNDRPAAQRGASPPQTPLGGGRPSGTSSRPKPQPGRAPQSLAQRGMPANDPFQMVKGANPLIGKKLGKKGRIKTAMNGTNPQYKGMI